jgi:hypothetical protein
MGRIARTALPRSLLTTTLRCDPRCGNGPSGPPGMRHRVDYLWTLLRAPREATNQDMQTKSGSRNSVKQKVRIGKQDDNHPSTDLQASPAISSRPTLCLPLHCSQDIDPIVSEIATPTHRWGSHFRLRALASAGSGGSRLATQAASAYLLLA